MTIGENRVTIRKNIPGDGNAMVGLIKSPGGPALKWRMLLILAPFFVVGCGLLGESELSESLTPAPIQGNVRGYPTARLTIFVWNDFQCPGCARWALGFEQDLIPRVSRPHFIENLWAAEYILDRGWCAGWLQN